MGKAPVYFSETITIGPHTYLMEVKRSQRGQKYFLITPTNAYAAEQPGMVVFANYMARFTELIERAAKAVAQNVPEVNAAAKREAKRKKAEARANRPKNQGRRWTAAHDSMLMANYHKGMSVHELAELLGRGKFSIEVRIASLGLYRAET